MVAADSFQFTADRGDARLRLDRTLVRRVTRVSRLSRSLAQQWIASGAVLVNNRPAVRPAMRLAEGDVVLVCFPASTVFRAEPAPEPMALDVRYQDESLLVLNKPAGVVVHPSYKQVTGTLLNAVLWLVRGYAGVQPGIVTRLDKGTSGLVLVALTPEVHAALQRDGARGRIRKSYLAVVRGEPRPRTGRIQLALARDPGDRRRMIATPDGMPCDTRYDVLSARATGTARESLVRCELVTGRTHQIRVHLAASGWPIVGDRTYGTPDPRIDRQALHASRLALAHPLTGQAIDIEAPLPADMCRLMPDTDTLFT